MRDELHTALYEAHPEELPKWVALRAGSLRDFKGDEAPELWNHLEEELISKLEQDQDKSVQRIEHHLTGFHDRYLSTP